MAGSICKTFENSLNSGEKAVKALKITDETNAESSRSALNFFEYDTVTAIKEMYKLKDRIEAVISYTEQKTNEMNLEKNQTLEVKKKAQEELDAAKRNIADAEQEYETKIRELESSKYNLDQQCKRRDEAQGKLNSAKWGIAFPPWLIYWGARELVQNNAEARDWANSRVKQCEETISKAKTVITSTRAKIRIQSKEIALLQDKIQLLNQNSENIIHTIRELNNIRVVLCTVIDRCNELIEKSHSAVTIKALINSLGEKPSSNCHWNSVSLIHSGGTKILVKSFEEAIEMIAEMIDNQDSATFLFNFQFTCSQCPQSFNTLPWTTVSADGCVVICCERCHFKLNRNRSSRKT